MIRQLAVATVVLALAMPAFAQKREEIRERVEQKIQTYLTVELTSRLSLDEKRALKLSDAIKAQMKRKQERREKLKTEMQKLNDLVEKKAADGQIKAQLDTVVGLAGRDEDMHDFLADTSKFLSVPEQAKLALAFPDIMKDMRHIIREARGGKRGPGGGFDED
jgi:hypothetical protein